MRCGLYLDWSVYAVCRVPLVCLRCLVCVAVAVFVGCVVLCVWLLFGVGCVFVWCVDGGAWLVLRV